MISEYRFLKTKNHTYFASVKIELKILDSGLEVYTDFVQEASDSSSEEYIPNIWVIPAIDGVKKSASIIFEKEKGISGFQVKIKEIQWNFVDTTEDAVHCAASLALFKLFPDTLAKTEIVFDEKWVIKIRD
jgi:hypothetical protein